MSKLRLVCKRLLLAGASILFFTPVFADEDLGYVGHETVDAKYEAGEKLLFGIGVPMDKASGWSVVMEAADEGSPKAMCLVGLGWEHGRDGPSKGRKDLAQATAWYVKAANAGHTEAMRRLWYGDTVGLTNQQKREWLLEAARRGNATAMTTLVVVLEKEGKGKDAFEAYVQLALSPLEKLHGDNKSMKRLAARTWLMRVSLQGELGMPPNRRAAYAWATLISEDPDAQGFKTARGNAAAERARAQLAKEAGTPMPTTVADHMAAWAKKLHQDATPEERADNARFLELARNRLELAVAHGRMVAADSEARAGGSFTLQEAQLLCSGEPSCLRFTVGTGGLARRNTIDEITAGDNAIAFIFIETEAAAR